jgi:hypothetical protein
MISFFLGERPPNPMFMEIVLPGMFDGRLSVTAVYNKWDPTIDPLESPITDDYILRVSRSLDL